MFITSFRSDGVKDDEKGEISRTLYIADTSEHVNWKATTDTAGIGDTPFVVCSQDATKSVHDRSTRQHDQDPAEEISDLS